MNKNDQFRCIKAACVIGAAVLAAATARADVTGSLWEGDGSGNADIVPGGTPNVTFTSPGINFDSRVTGYSIGQFLAGSTILTGASELGNAVDNVHIQLTGTIFLTAGANPFNITHDDGLRLVLDGGIGNVLDTPGPTPPTTTAVSIVAPATGVYTFTLDYNECCGPPAVLQWTYPSGAPVTGAPDGGTTLVLLGLAVSGLGALRRQLRK